LSDLQQRRVDLGFEDIQLSQLIELSSGAHKKLQLICGLWAKPQLFILDEPYSGSDTESKTVLNAWLDDLVQEGVQPFIITNDTRLPNAINRYAHLVDGQIDVVDSPKDFAKDKKRSKKALPAFLKEIPSTTYDTVAELNNIGIRY